MKEYIEYAYKLVSDYKRFDIKTKTINPFPVELIIPDISGIFCKLKGKDLLKSKPNVIEYIMINLHNVEHDLLVDAIIAYFYYWKVRKKEPNTMKKAKEILLEHFAVINNQDVPVANIENKAIVYSISFCIGSNQIHKIGYAEDKNRYSKLLSDIRTKYPFVSVGSFKVNQEIQFDDITKAKEYEQEQLTKLKQDISYKKCKYCFDGYKEAYYSNNPYKLL